MKRLSDMDDGERMEKLRHTRERLCDVALGFAVILILLGVFTVIDSLWGIRARLAAANCYEESRYIGGHPERCREQ